MASPSSLKSESNDIRKLRDKKTTNSKILRNQNHRAKVSQVGLGAEMRSFHVRYVKIAIFPSPQIAFLENKKMGKINNIRNRVVLEERLFERREHLTIRTIRNKV